MSLIMAPALNAQSHARHDSVVGALIGGIAGAVVGHQSDHAAEGAAVGVVTGAGIGYMHGNERDKRYGHQSYGHRRPQPRQMPYYDRGHRRQPEFTCRPPVVRQPRIYVPRKPYRSHRTIRTVRHRSYGPVRVTVIVRQ